jgi:hypothetical protein
MAHHGSSLASRVQPPSYPLKRDDADTPAVIHSARTTPLRSVCAPARACDAQTAAGPGPPSRLASFLNHGRSPSACRDGLPRRGGSAERARRAAAFRGDPLCSPCDDENVTGVPVCVGGRLPTRLVTGIAWARWISSLFFDEAGNAWQQLSERGKHGRVELGD